MNEEFQDGLIGDSAQNSENLFPVYAWIKVRKMNRNKIEVLIFLCEYTRYRMFNET